MVCPILAVNAPIHPRIWSPSLIFFCTAASPPCQYAHAVACSAASWTCLGEAQVLITSALRVGAVIELSSRPFPFSLALAVGHSYDGPRRYFGILMANAVLFPSRIWLIPFL